MILAKPNINMWISASFKSKPDRKKQSLFSDFYENNANKNMGVGWGCKLVCGLFFLKS